MRAPYRLGRGRFVERLVGDIAGVAFAVACSRLQLNFSLATSRLPVGEFRIAKIEISSLWQAFRGRRFWRKAPGRLAAEDHF